MWMVIVFILVAGKPMIWNAIPIPDQQMCREVADISNRLFPERFTICVDVGEDT